MRFSYEMTPDEAEYLIRMIIAILEERSKKNHIHLD